MAMPRSAGGLLFFSGGLRDHEVAMANESSNEELWGQWGGTCYDWCFNGVAAYLTFRHVSTIFKVFIT